MTVSYWANTRSGLLTKMGAGGRKLYVPCEEDNCEGCADSCQLRPVCQDGCRKSPRCNRHFIMEWNESTRFSVADQRGVRAIGESEWGERLEEGIDRITRIRKDIGLA